MDEEVIQTFKKLAKEGATIKCGYIVEAKGNTKICEVSNATDRS